MYIDIRDKNDFLKGHIDGAVNINYIDLILNPERFLKKDNLYYIYCNTGLKSKSVVLKLKKMGYNCVNYDGGYNYYLLNKHKI